MVCHVQAIAHPVMCFVTNSHLTRDRARDGAIITHYKLSTRGAQQPETISLMRTSDRYSSIGRML